MRAVRMIRTRDGQLHPDETAARRHAEKLYGEALSRIAAILAPIDKYTAMHLKVEELSADGKFIELAALQADCRLERCAACKGRGEVETGIGMQSCSDCGGTGDA